MRGRRAVRSAVVDAWSQCVSEDYANQRINSERSLQAAIWSRLNTSLPPTRRLFIEPTVRLSEAGGDKRVIPDLVICNTREVICVVELKYLPRARPRYSKDLASLASISEGRGSVTIANDRFRGAEKDSKAYALSDRVLFVWAGIHKGPVPDDSFGSSYASLEGCYLELHAVTQPESSPEILIRG